MKVLLHTQCHVVTLSVNVFSEIRCTLLLRVYFDSSLFSEITVFPEILSSTGLMLSFIIHIYINLH